MADSICTLLYKYESHSFIVVLSTAMEHTRNLIEGLSNIKIYSYDLKKTLASTLFLRDDFLDNLVIEEKVDAVLTVFGPSRWKPKIPHLCGFARAQILPMDTPYFSHLSVKEKFINFFVRNSFARSAEFYWTENPSVTELLQRVFPEKKVFTVSNNYNQVFNQRERWIDHPLPSFQGTTLLTVTNPYPHKNLSIAIDMAKVLKKKYPDFKFRFVFTINKHDYYALPSGYEDCFCFIGKVDISECPSLYQQADIMFQPTLLECFTATYAEAMKMDVPILTTNLDFSRGLCGEAAVYYSPMSAEDAAHKAFELANDEHLRRKMINKGHEQLSTFESAETRADKLISIMNHLSK